jgi:DNA-binding transcriptional ArsR family regulator
MPDVLLTGPADLLRVRFAVSPLFETMDAVRLLGGHREGRRHHAAWLAAIGPDAGEGLDALRALHGARGYVPDFVSPPPTRPVPLASEQIAEVRATPLDRVSRELLLCRAGELTQARQDAVDELLRDPAAARERLADELELAFERLLAPAWPRVLALLEADISHRSAVLASRGLRAALAGLHPGVRTTDEAVEVDGRPERTERELAGEGLLLVPSAFVWPDPVVILEAPWQPTLVYPVRGVAELWRSRPLPSPAALGRLLGTTRARILGALGEPASTTAIARSLGLSAAGVSAHLAALRDAGLAETSRRGREVRYVRSPLGDALVDANARIPAHTNLT